MPGASIGQAREIMRHQDSVLASFPEVASVLGKAGRASTATDPAPLDMFETTLTLKPESEWRAGMTYERLIAAPMVGGMVSSSLLTLVVIPAIYVLWRWRRSSIVS